MATLNVYWTDEIECAREKAYREHICQIEHKSSESQLDRIERKLDAVLALLVKHNSAYRE